MLKPKTLRPFTLGFAVNCSFCAIPLRGKIRFPILRSEGGGGGRRFAIRCLALMPASPGIPTHRALSSSFLRLRYRILY